MRPIGIRPGACPQGVPPVGCWCGETASTVGLHQGRKGSGEEAEGKDAMCMNEGRDGGPESRGRFRKRITGLFPFRNLIFGSESHYLEVLLSGFFEPPLH